MLLENVFIVSICLVTDMLVYIYRAANKTVFKVACGWPVVL